jgi:hypothetical protein
MVFHFVHFFGTLSTMRSTPVGFPFLSKDVFSSSFGSLISFHICFCVFIFVSPSFLVCSNMVIYILGKRLVFLFVLSMCVHILCICILIVVVF